MTTKVMHQLQTAVNPQFCYVHSAVTSYQREFLLHNQVVYSHIQHFFVWVKFNYSVTLDFLSQRAPVAHHFSIRFNAHDIVRIHFDYL
jgi:hypothetical protein